MCLFVKAYLQKVCLFLKAYLQKDRLHLHQILLMHAVVIVVDSEGVVVFQNFLGTAQCLAN